MTSLYKIHTSYVMVLFRITCLSEFTSILYKSGQMNVRNTCIFQTSSSRFIYS